MIDGVKTTEFPLKANTPNKETQRIAIAQMGPLSYLVVTTEGPENPGSTGLTLPEFARCSMIWGHRMPTTWTAVRPPA